MEIPLLGVPRACFVLWGASSSKWDLLSSAHLSTGFLVTWVIRSENWQFGSFGNIWVAAKTQIPGSLSTDVIQEEWTGDSRRPSRSPQLGYTSDSFLPRCGPLSSVLSSTYFRIVSLYSLSLLLEM